MRHLAVARFPRILPLRPMTSCRFCHKLSRADRRLAAWIALSLATLLPVVCLLLSGALSPLNEAQLRLLAGHPFYIDAEAAQVSMLSPIGTFVLCTVLTLWLAAVLLREHRLGRRTQVAFLAALAMALPGLICVLWSGVLYVAAPLACVALLWGCTVPLKALWCLLHARRSNSPTCS